jgi:D-alanyl-lipoteichoic acid acyltransferase DltB (MBOAT superfamily)
LLILTTITHFYAGLIIDDQQIERMQRIKVSLLTIILTFLLLIINYQSLFLTNSDNTSSLIVRDTFTWILFGLIVLLVGLLNLGYVYTHKISKKSIRNFFLIFSVTFSLALLGVFKYFNFFISSAERLLTQTGLEVNLISLQILLPVGISFFTFQTLTYTIDIYRSKFSATKNFLNFSLFVAYFPSLLAGPIERAYNLLPRLSKARQITLIASIEGASLFVIGLFKKVAIADGIAKTVDSVFNYPSVPSSINVIIAICAFAIKIYADFSGYTDMARGVSKMLGIELIDNFKTPYFALDPRDFWRRWHISLSTWLRDYLYIPLGGSKQSQLMTYRNLMITMTLGGLWHGAAWNFVFWGIYQGLLLCLNNMFSFLQQQKQGDSFIKLLYLRVIWLPLILYGWLLFRSESLDQIVKLTKGIFNFSSFHLITDTPRLSTVVGLPILIVIEIFEYTHNNDKSYHKNLSSNIVKGFICALIIFSTLLGFSNETEQFIYFNF